MLLLTTVSVSLRKYFHSSYHEEQRVYCYRKKKEKEKVKLLVKDTIKVKQSTIQNIGSLLVSVI